MPTWKGMFTARRALVTFCVAIVVFSALCVIPAAADPADPSSSTTTTVPAPGGASTTTTTTVPPPPAFAFPTTYGLELLQAQDQAQKTLALARAELPAARRGFANANRESKLAARQLKSLQAAAHRNAEQLDASRRNLREAAAEAYINADGGDLAAAIGTLTSANDVVDAGRQLHIITEYGSSEQSALNAFISLKNEFDTQIARIAVLRDRKAKIVRDARSHLDDVQNTIAASQKQLADSLVGIAKFYAAASSASSPILGPSRLSANQMADFVTSQHYTPNITVPILDLAQMYLDEGARTGVRGDVAFAQSILETGGFANPGAAPTDNNFAGIGWCDSCSHGFIFPSALMGVRAQLQLLRTYVDPFFPQPAYTDQILMPGTLNLGFRGKVQTWWDLWHTWATGALYGQRVYDIYERMVLFSATDPPLPRVVPLEELQPAPLPGVSTTTVTIGWPTGGGPGTKNSTTTTTLPAKKP